MANKNLDGIAPKAGQAKKLNDQEREQSRKIVLDFIGEKDRRKKEEAVTDSGSKKGRALDGISLVKSKKIAKAAEEGNKKLIIEKEKLEVKALINEEIEEEKNRAAMGRPEQKLAAESQGKENKEWAEKIRKEEEIKTRMKKKRQERKLRANLIKEEQKLVKLKKVQRKKDKKRQIKGGENQRKEKRKQAKINKKMIRGEKKKKEREARKWARLQKRKERLDKIKQSWTIFRGRLIIILRNIFSIRTLRFFGRIFIFSVYFLITLTILGYFILAVFLLRFNFSNTSFKEITKYVPVPAIVTQIGVVGYFEYQEAIDSFSQEYDDEDELKEAVKVKFVRDMILNNLAEKYGLGGGVEDLGEVLNEKLIHDQEINKVVFMRLEEIAQMIKNAGLDITRGQDVTFDEIGDRYVDGKGYINESKDYLELAEAAKDLEPGEISDVIIAGEGYYLIEEEAGQAKFIFIQAINLDRYLDGVMSKLKVWVLVD